MKQKKMLALTPSQLKQLYRHELPELTGIAARSGDAQTFKTYLSEYMAGHPQAESEAGKLIRLLIDYDGQKVHELSTDKQLPVSTLSLLYDFLTGKLEEYLETDLFFGMQFFKFKVEAFALEIVHTLAGSAKSAAGSPHGIGDKNGHLRIASVDIVAVGQ